MDSQHGGRTSFLSLEDSQLTVFERQGCALMCQYADEESLPQAPKAPIHDFTFASLCST